MNTVWIVNHAGHDFSDAERFGDLRYLTRGQINPFQIDRLALHLAKGIGKWSRPQDYLLISGTPVISMLAFYLWLSTHEQCQLLQWNAINREYELSTLTREQLSRLAEEALIT